MACPMCEAHIQDTIRNHVPGAKKVKANHVKKTAVFRTEEQIDEDALKKAIDATGYQFEGISQETVEKKGLFHRG